MLIDPSGRGPTMRRLLVTGSAGVVVVVALLWLLLLRYEGLFTDKVTVTANLTSTGDGLVDAADVKFRGIWVGTVRTAREIAAGRIQQLTIDLKPQYASAIPDTVTARVIPSDVFAITAIQLVDNGPGSAVRSGSQIAQDTSDATIQLQNTLTSARNVLQQLDPAKLGRIMGTLSYALDPGARVPGSTIDRLDHWVVEMRAAIPNLGGDLTTFSGATHALNQSAPELLDALGTSVSAAKTMADRRVELEELLTGTGGALTTVNNLFADNPNVGKEVTMGLNETFAALDSDPASLPATIDNLNTAVRKLNTTFRWGPSGQMVWRAGISFSPFTPYTRADCPRYGPLAGPSCATAPAMVIEQPLPQQLRPRSLTGTHYLSTDGTPVPTPDPAAEPRLAGTPLARLFGYAPSAPTPAGVASMIGGPRR